MKDHHIGLPANRKGRIMMGKLVVASCVMLALCLVGQAFAQEAKINKTAQAVVDKHLKGMSLSDLQEGRDMINETSWDAWQKPPLFLKYETLYEKMFDTDIPTIKGYKRLISAQIKPHYGDIATCRYVIVAYPGFQNKKWQVLIISTSVDLDKEVAAAERDLDDPKNLDEPQFRQDRIAYWLSAVGLLNKAVTAYKIACKLDREVPTKYPEQAHFEKSLQVLQKITGMN